MGEGSNMLLNVLGVGSLIKSLPKNQTWGCLLLWFLIEAANAVRARRSTIFWFQLLFLHGRVYYILDLIFCYRYCKHLRNNKYNMKMNIHNYNANQEHFLFSNSTTSNPSPLAHNRSNSGSLRKQTRSPYLQSNH